jgi:hypothetical protein
MEKENLMKVVAGGRLSILFYYLINKVKQVYRLKSFDIAYDYQTEIYIYLTPYLIYKGVVIFNL